MKHFLFFLLSLIILIKPDYGQVNRNGYPFVRYYKPSEMHAADQNWSAARDKRGVMYFANMDNGVLEFDGTTWKDHPLPGNVKTRAVFVSQNGILYAAGDKEFGFFQPDAAGNLIFTSLASRLDSTASDFTSIYTINEWKDYIVFATTRQFYFYNPTADTVIWHSLDEDGFQSGNYSFVVGDHYFHGEYSKGLLEYDGEHFKLVKNASAFAIKAILSVLPLDDDQVLVLTYRNGAYAYNLSTGAVNPDIFSEEANNFLKNYRFYRGQELPDGSFALGTIDAGLLIVNSDGEIEEILGNETEIGNTPVTNVYYDKRSPFTSQLWLPLNIGIAKVEWFSPFRYFDESHGFQGSINDLIYFHDYLYLATSNGVFYRTENDQGRVTFKKVEGVNTQAWSFLSFTPPGSSSQKLWVGTEEGIYDITSLARPRLIEEGIPNLEPRGRKFYVYKLFASRQYPYKVFVGTNKNLVILEYRTGKWYQKLAINDFTEEIRSIDVDNKGNIWFSTNYTGLARLSFLENNKYDIQVYGAKDGLERNSDNKIFRVDDKLYSGNNQGIYYYSPEKDVFISDTTFFAESGSRKGVYQFEKLNGRYFFSVIEPNGTNHIEMVIPEKGMLSKVTMPFYRLPQRSVDAFCSEGNLIWIGISNQLFSYNTESGFDFNSGYKTILRKITIGEDSLIFGGSFPQPVEGNLSAVTDIQPVTMIPDLQFSFNNLTFHWASPYFVAEDHLEFSYRLRGFDDSWSRWTKRYEFPYTNIPHGDFVFEVKARNIFGVESSAASFTLAVQPPWYLRIWAFILYTIIAFFLIVIIVRLYTRRLQNEKIRLEGIVAERTAEVVRQKEELTDSITYASRIQKAVLPSEILLNEQFPEHFILFKPRDIVSGDFYWMTKKHSKIFISAADCTGHGVPGAFMSLLGISFLNEIVSKSEMTEAGQILDELRKYVMTSLKQKGEEGETKDGMDMSFCVIDRENKTLQFAGAYNPLYYVRPLSATEKKDIQAGNEPDFPRGSIYDEQNVLIQYSADKMPIGISAKDQQSFTNHTLPLVPGHRIYMFSDGYVDQFGGANNKKFMSRNFKRLILSIQDTPMKDQGHVLDQKLLEWIGDNPQIDDIIVIGLKLN